MNLIITNDQYLLFTFQKEARETAEPITIILCLLIIITSYVGSFSGQLQKHYKGRSYLCPNDVVSLMSNNVKHR